MKMTKLNPLVTGAITCGVMGVLVVAIFVSGMPAGPQLPLLSGNPMVLKVELADADALAPHAAVQIAGVKIGEVRNVDSAGDKALVTMAIERQYNDVHTDARALLRPHGLFGPKYIELEPGTSKAPQLQDGDTIPGANTVLPVDLDQVLHELQAPERQQIRTAFIELGKAAAGRGSDVNSLVAAANTLTDTLQSPINRINNVDPNLSDMLVQNEAFNASFSQAPLDQLVAYNNTVLRSFAGSSQQLQDLLVHADSALTNLDAALNGQSGNIRGFLETVPGTIDRLDRFNDLLAVFGANFTGQEPGVTDIRSGLRDAIINPESAFASYDVCDPSTAAPGNQSNPPTCTPSPGAKPGPDGKIHDGQRHYVRNQAFNAAGSGSLPTLPAPPAVLCQLPVLGLGNPVGPTIGCPANTGAASTSSPTDNLAVAGAGGSLASLSDLLAP